MVEARKEDNICVFGPVDPKNAEGRVKSPGKLPINCKTLTATIKVFENAKLEKSKPYGKEI